MPSNALRRFLQNNCKSTKSVSRRSARQSDWLRTNSFKPLLEVLEDRTLLSVTAVADSANPGKFIVSFAEDASGASDSLVVRLNAGMEVEYDLNNTGFTNDLDSGTPGVQSLVINDISQIQINLGTGTNVVTIDNSNGSVVPTTLGILDQGDGDDSLVVTGTAGGNPLDVYGDRIQVGSGVSSSVYYSGLGHLRVDGRDNDAPDELVVYSTSVATDVYAGTGDRLWLEPTAAFVAGLALHGNGSSQLTVENSANTVGTTVTVSPTQVGAAPGDSIFGAGGGLSYNGIASLTLNMGSGTDTINVTPSATTQFFINGNSPATAPGDLLNIDQTGVTDPLLTGEIVGTGQWTSSNRQTVAFTGIEKVIPNAAPDNIQLSLSSISIDENDTVTLGGSFTDADPSQIHRIVINWGDGTSSAVNLAAGVSSFSGISHAYGDNPSGEPTGSFVITVTVADNFGGSGEGTTAIQVNNRVPTASLAGPTGGIAFQPLTFMLGATDPSVVDQAVGFTYAIQWGDGTGETVSGLSGLALTHSYTTAGNHIVTLTATDQDNGVSTVVSQTVNISGIPQIQDGILLVPGTVGNDTLVLTQVSAGSIRVTRNGVNLGTFAPSTGAIQVFGGSGTDSVTVTGATGADAFSVNGATVRLNGFTITLNSIEATVLNGGGGLDTLTGPDATNLWQITGANAGNLNGATRFTSIEHLVGGGADDSFTFQNNTAALTGTIDGGAGANMLDYAGRTTAVAVTLKVSGAHQATAMAGWRNIGTLRGSAATTDTLVGADSANTWSINAVNGGSIGGFAFQSFENLTGGATNDTFAFAAGGALTGKIDGKLGTNTLDYAALSSPVTVNLQTKTATGIGVNWANIGAALGTDTADTLIGASVANTWNLTGSNAGNVNATFAFSGFANLTGGTGADTFKFGNGSTLAGTADGKAGSNTFDYSADTLGVTVNLATQTATQVGSFNNIGIFKGGAGTDTLAGANAASTWNITATNSGTVGGTAFSFFENLTGGTGNDNFKVAAAGGITGLLDGGVGAGDQVAITQNADFTLSAGLIVRSVGLAVNFANMEAVLLTGGTGNNSFTVTDWSGAATLAGAAGTDTVISSNDADFSLANALLTRSTGGSFILTGIEQAQLTGGASNNVIDASAFTGLAILNGVDGNDTLSGGAGASTLLGGDGDDILTGGLGNDSIQGGNGNDTLMEAGNVSFTLTNTNLTGLGTDTLTGLEHAQLTGGASANLFSLNGWTGTAVVDGGAGTTDRVAVTQDTDFTLNPGLIARSTAGAVTFANTELVTLTGGAGNNTFTVSGWSAAATLAGGAGTDTVICAGDANFTLTDTLLSRSTGGSFTLSAVEQARLTGGAGNNTLNATGFNLGSVTLDGAGGNDVLTGGSRDDLLLGGAGNDTLNGGSGRDFLLGGADSDALVGGAGEDILAHGTTTYDVFGAAFASVLAEWRRTDLTYAQRVAHLKTDSGGLNGANLLNNTTLIDDAFANTLTGGTSLDWFFAKQPGDTITDRVNPTESVNS